MPLYKLEVGLNLEIRTLHEKILSSIGSTEKLGYGFFISVTRRFVKILEAASEVKSCDSSFACVHQEGESFGLTIFLSSITYIVRRVFLFCFLFQFTYISCCCLYTFINFVQQAHLTLSTWTPSFRMACSLAFHFFFKVCHLLKSSSNSACSITKAPLLTSLNSISSHPPPSPSP